MMDAARLLVVLGQDDAVAAQLVDRADMFAVAADDFHMLAHLLARLTLLAAPRAPTAALIVDAFAVFALIFGIVAVQFVDPLPIGRAPGRERECKAVWHLWV